MTRDEFVRETVALYTSLIDLSEVVRGYGTWTQAQSESVHAHARFEMTEAVQPGPVLKAALAVLLDATDPARDPAALKAPLSKTWFDALGAAASAAWCAIQHDPGDRSLTGAGVEVAAAAVGQLPGQDERDALAVVLGRIRDRERAEVTA